MTTIDRVLACPTLPTLPAVAVEVLALTRSPDVSLADISRVVQNDPALASKLLKTVNIGVLACVAALGDEYVSTLATAPSDHDLHCRHEREVFPFDHTTIGAELAKRWKLPDIFHEVIRKHHTPEGDVSAIPR